MIRYFQKTFALTEQGARDLLRASLWQVAANISLMLPVGVLVAALTGFVEALSAGAPFTAGGRRARFRRGDFGGDFLHPVEAV